MSGALRRSNADDSLNHVAVPRGFDVVERVHPGNVSDIWKITDRQTGQLFALKCLNAEASVCSENRQRFQREVKSALSIKGKFVCRAEDSGRIRLMPYLIMEWLDGKTIAEQLSTGEYFSIGRSIWNIRQAAAGLQELATAGYSHGNVSLAHLMPNGEGELKLIGTSSARSIDVFYAGESPARENYGAGDLGHTELKNGSHTGTVSFDIFCLGTAWYEMLIGESLLDLYDDARNNTNVTAAQLMERRPTIPVDVAELVAKLLSPEPLRRPQSFLELTRRLIEIEIRYMPIQYRIDGSRTSRSLGAPHELDRTSSNAQLPKAG